MVRPPATIVLTGVLALSLRLVAQLVSSVHSPAASSRGPPWRNSETSAKVPGRSNSMAAPKASPMAKPMKQPRCRSLISNASVT
jgi:hypothetical protein